MRIPQSQSYIKSNPRFALTSDARPANLHRGQMTELYDSMEPYPTPYSLEQLVARCEKRDYRSTFRNPGTHIRISILYQINRLLKGTDQVPANSIRIL